MNLFEIFKNVFAWLSGSMNDDIPAYSALRQTYKYAIQDAILEYLVDPKTNPVKHRNKMKKAMATAFSSAFRRGYMDAGGDINKISSDDRRGSAINKQRNLGLLINFLTAEGVKREPDEDNTGEVNKRIESLQPIGRCLMPRGRLRVTGNRATFTATTERKAARVPENGRVSGTARIFWVTAD
jgi:hypothetical protein